jgi:DNA-binding XRE family transcriptional regulator
MGEHETDDGARAEYERGTGILCVFGRQMKLFRQRAGLERRDVGTAMGCAASTIAAFEQGAVSRRPGSSTRSTDCWTRAVS